MAPKSAKRKSTPDPRLDSTSSSQTCEVYSTPPTTPLTSSAELDSFQKTIYVIRLCCLSAFLSTCGSAFAKYSLTYDQVGEFLSSQCAAAFTLPAQQSTELTLSTTQQIAVMFPWILPTCITTFSFLVKIIQLGLTLGLNTLGLAYSLPASHASSSSLATTLCNAAGFILNAIFGVFLFNETITPQFAVGLAFILFGIGILCVDNMQQTAAMEYELKQQQMQQKQQNTQDNDETTSPTIHSTRSQHKPTPQLSSNDDTDTAGQTDKKAGKREKSNKSIFAAVHDFFEPLEHAPGTTLFLGVLTGAWVVIGTIYYIVFTNAP